MDHLLKVTMVGLISGIIGTGAGGLSAFLVSNIGNRLLSFVLEFSAGLMTGVVCFELIPEAFALGGIRIPFIGILIGILSMLMVESFIKKAEFLKRGYKNSNLLRAGILTAIGISLHNFPEGFAVGSGFQASFSLGVTLTAVILIHDIPEGISVAVPLRAGGFGKMKAFVLTVLSGLPMGVGAFAGALLGEISKAFIAICLGFAGGAMLYIVYGELVPESKRLYKGRLPSLGNILGILCGIIVSVWN